MALRPLLTLPSAVPIDPPAGQRFPGRPPQLPGGRQQRRRLEGQYQRLVRAQRGAGGLMSLRADPGSIAPHRAIVFEIAGNVANFYKAARNVPGLEFLAEEDLSFDAGDGFATLRDGEVVPEAPVSGKRYLAMPTEGALNDILALYSNWRRGRKLPRGLTPWRDVFKQLKTMRPWGPQDRIPDDAIAVWQEEIDDAGLAEVAVEAELWFQGDAQARTDALAALTAAVEDLEGRVVTSALVPEILYHAALVTLPADGVRHLIARDDVALVLADQVMFLRPQSLIRGAPTEPAAPDARVITRPAAPIAGSPVAALLDGVPLQNHAVLANRLSIDDPDGLERLAVVGERHHGTAMASLILHGDLNGDGRSLARPLHVHPILYAAAAGRPEETSPTQLLVDTIYRAVVRMKDPATPGGPSAPDIFLINLSLGDRRRVFAGPMSPLGKLLDYLAGKYNVLFLVSAGNIKDDVALDGFNTLAEVEALDPPALAQAFLAHLRNTQASRCLYAPAEALNPLTIAAAHEDSVPAGFPHRNTIAPFANPGFPNVSSALGLGHRRVIKPDLALPGGRERLAMRANRPLVLAHPPVAHGFGLKAAAPDPAGRGQLDRRSLSTGTSAATALATRTAHLIFDSMMDVEGGSNLSEIEPVYWPVVVKALLAHSARWPAAAEVIANVFGPADPRRRAERDDNVARLIGYGTPLIDRVIDCSPAQATLVGYGDLTSAFAHQYRVPLPACLEAVTEPRTVVLTVAWLSPVSPVHQDYRRAQLYVDVPGRMAEIGVDRDVGAQPSDYASRRGSLIHEIYTGEDAVVFVDDSVLVVNVWCRERPSGLRLANPVRYALALTIEAGTALPVYQQMDIRLRALVEGRGG